MQFDDLSERLARDGVSVDSRVRDQLEQHAALVREYNEIVSLVSARDITLLEELHIPDSLSLAPYVVGLAREDTVLLDVGTGGGFPAIPLKILFPELGMVLIERRQTRVGFLRNVVATLGLDDVAIEPVDFPREYVDCGAAIVSARAVEKADKVCKGILQVLPVGATWLCQSGGPEKLLGSKFHVERLEDDHVIGTYAGQRFHVEPVEDDWTRDGLRRGSLHLVRRLNPQ